MCTFSLNVKTSEREEERTAASNLSNLILKTQKRIGQKLKDVLGLITTKFDAFKRKLRPFKCNLFPICSTLSIK